MIKFPLGLFAFCSSFHVYIFILWVQIRLLIHIKVIIWIYFVTKPHQPWGTWQLLLGVAFCLTLGFPISSWNTKVMRSCTPSAKMLEMWLITIQKSNKSGVFWVVSSLGYWCQVETLQASDVVAQLGPCLFLESPCACILLILEIEPFLHSTLLHFWLSLSYQCTLQKSSL